MTDHISALMPELPNVNNVNTTKTINNTNVNNVTETERPKRRKNPYNRTAREAQAITDKLMAALSDTQSYVFYCKVAWNLPEAAIWSELEKALTKGHPAAYFSTVCKAKMRELYTD